MEVFAPKQNGNEPSLNWTSLLLLLILLTLVAFGAFYFGKGKKEVPAPSPTATTQAEIVLTPSLEATVSASPAI